MRLEIELEYDLSRISGTDLWQILVLYASPGISPNAPSQGLVIFIGEEGEANMRYQLLREGHPTPDIHRALEDLYEGALSYYLIPRLFGIKK